MLINNLLYTILSIAIPIILWIGLSVFIKKKWHSYYGILIGLVLSAFAFGAFQAFGKIYIVDKKFNVSCYRLIGTQEYQFDDGSRTTVSLSQRETGIVNNSGEELVIDQITYGSKGHIQTIKAYNEITKKSNQSETSGLVILPFSIKCVIIPMNTIDFFFDEKIPEVIEEYGNPTKIKKFWLHLNKPPNN